MAEGFVTYSARNFEKRLDKFRSKRVDTVKIRHLIMERAHYDLLKFEIAALKELNLNFLLAKIFNKAYSLTSTLKFPGAPRMVRKDALLWFLINFAQMESNCGIISSKNRHA